MCLDSLSLDRHTSSSRRQLAIVAPLAAADSLDLGRDSSALSIGSLLVITLTYLALDCRPTACYAVTSSASAAPPGGLQFARQNDIIGYGCVATAVGW